MNTFLQGCCFIPPEDDSVSTPSYVDFAPRFLPSSRASSKTNSYAKSLGSQEIIYIKRYPGEAWVDLEESQSQSFATVKKVPKGHSKTFIERARLSGTASLGGSTSTPRTRRRKGSSSNAPLIQSEEDFAERMSFWTCQPRTQRPESSSYISTYSPKSPRRPTTSTSRLLDFISMCFWKCSPGCQQIPTVNT